MLNAMRWILKAAFFTAVVLVAAHYIKWDGKTVSDQVASTLSSAERKIPIKVIHRESEDLIHQAKKITEKATARITIDRASRKSASLTPPAPRNEAFPEDDRAELQALISSDDE